MELEKYILEICRILKIAIPSIRIDNIRLQTSTTLAQYDPYNKIIYVRKYDNKLRNDFFFSIAHELRHAWQWKNKKSYYFDNYKPSHLMPDIYSYNMQVAEIDANAFATIVMTDVFGVEPLFDNLPADVKQAIESRVREIVEIELF